MSQQTVSAAVSEPGVRLTLCPVLQQEVQPAGKLLIRWVIQLMIQIILAQTKIVPVTLIRSPLKRRDFNGLSVAGLSLTVPIALAVTVSAVTVEVI